MMFQSRARENERPTHATVRTAWSSPDEAQRKAWVSFHTQLAAEAKRYTRNESSSGLVLIGDSIFERLRGTSYGRFNPTATELPGVLASTLGKRWENPTVLAISGDQTQHVLWRVANGEISVEMARDPNLIVVLLIGTNNLGRGHLPEETASGIIAIIRRLLARVRGRILVAGVLPRGDGPSELPKLCPPRCNHQGEPFNSFEPAVERVNMRVRMSALSFTIRYPKRVIFVDCGHVFRRHHNSSLEQVSLALMPDRLHPNADGYRALLQCLEPPLRRLDGSRPR
uniref:SGNH hydrolase-type esterase domain-containing protein n=1 Tax=Coccolithus braarudii TaxID=221442 RepID=A0A6T7HXT1_9EUKA